jgi:hypothetical protein
MGDIFGERADCRDHHCSAQPRCSQRPILRRQASANRSISQAISATWVNKLENKDALTASMVEDVFEEQSQFRPAVRHLDVACIASMRVITMQAIHIWNHQTAWNKHHSNT